jgi:hypothetical protein
VSSARKKAEEFEGDQFAGIDARTEPVNHTGFIIFKNRKSGELLLNQQNRDEHGKFSGGGVYCRIDAEQMRKDGLHGYDLFFNVTGVRTFEEASEIEAASVGEQNLFYETHRAVWIFRPAQDEIVFWPMRPVWQGDRVISVYLAPEDASHLPWPTTPENFFESLMAAFDIAR